MLPPWKIRQRPSADEISREEKRPNSAANAAPAPDLKDKLYIHTDGINISAPWRLADYGEKGALSEDDFGNIGLRFDLPRTVLQNLSIEIGNSLDIVSIVNVTTVTRDVAIDRANKALKDAAERAKRVVQELSAIRRLVSPLSDAFVSEAEQQGVLASAKQRAEAAQKAAASLYEAIGHVISHPGSAAVISPADKRRISDGRRRKVVETCCYNWRDAGRAVTYTTKPERIGDQRGGPLIDFIQAVVMMVTDPPSKLSGETIRKDIDRWNRTIRRCPGY